MVIGRGAFGKVYLGEDIETKKLYAIKTIKKSELIKSGMIELAEQEAEILQDINHPFLIDLAFMFHSKYRIFFVQPFVEGGELTSLLQKHKRFQEDAILFFGAQLVLAIGHLHEHHIVHRDMKLDNVLVDRDGYIKVIDYGIARRLGADEDA